jgi:hypothetical protein
MNHRWCLAAAYMTILCIALIARPGHANDEGLVETHVYATSFRFGGKYWALPEGDWETLAVTRKFAPDTGRSSLRASLARFGANRRPVAFLLYAVGEVGDAPEHTMANAKTCMPTLMPVQTGRRVIDPDNNFSCWTIRFLDATTWIDDPVYNAVR